MLPPADAPQQLGDGSRPVGALPSHISAFGEGTDDEHQQQEEEEPAAGRTSRGVRFDDEEPGVSVLDAMTAAAAAQLPSHISAFGDDLGSNLQGACAALAGSEELEPDAAASKQAVQHRGLMASSS